MTSQILCATDGSDHAERAVTYAVQFAKVTGAKLTFLASNIIMTGGMAPSVLLWDDAEVKKMLDAATAVAKGAGLTDTRAVAVSGRDPATAIVRYAEEHGIDHIVTGTGGRSGISRLVVGSVASDVASKAHCSVTIAR
jgi:nucleotide-binding universal stress UspA family protein